MSIVVYLGSHCGPKPERKHKRSFSPMGTSMNHLSRLNQLASIVDVSAGYHFWSPSDDILIRMTLELRSYVTAEKNRIEWTGVTCWILFRNKYSEAESSMSWTCLYVARSRVGVQFFRWCGQHTKAFIRYPYCSLSCLIRTFEDTNSAFSSDWVDLQNSTTQTRKVCTLSCWYVSIPKIIICTLIMNARRVDCSTKLQYHVNFGNGSFAQLGPVFSCILQGMKLWVTESLRKIIGSELLPGRRWLLSSDSRNQHISYDLHIPSPRPQKLANSGQCDHKDRTRGELRSLKIWVDSWNVIQLMNWKLDTNPLSPVTRTFIYENSVFENYSYTTTTIYSTRRYLFMPQTMHDSFRKIFNWNASDRVWL